MIQDKKVIIAIPIYRDLREEEIVALDNNLEILRNYPTVLIKPTGLNTNALKERYPQVGEIEVSNQWLGTINGIMGYNEMMTSPDFYSLFSDYEYLLICQTDVPMAAHGYDRKHRKEFWSKFIPKEAFKKQ